MTPGSEELRCYCRATFGDPANFEANRCDLPKNHDGMHRSTRDGETWVWDMVDEPAPTKPEQEVGG